MNSFMRAFARAPKSTRVLGRNKLPRSTPTVRPVRTGARPSGLSQPAQPSSGQSHRGGGVPVQTSRPPQVARPTNNIAARHTHAQTQNQNQVQAPTTGRPQGMGPKGLPKFAGIGNTPPKASGSAGSKHVHADPPRAAVARKEPAFGFHGVPNNFTGTVHLQANGRWDIRPDGDRRLSGVPPEAKDAVVHAMSGFTKAEQMRGIGIRVIYRFDGSVDVETHHLPYSDVARSAPAALPHKF